MPSVDFGASLDGSPFNASVFLTATTFIAGILWGFTTSLYSLSMYSLIRSLRPAKATNKTTLLVLIVWSTTLWVLSSLFTMAAAYCTLYEYSWQLDYPGGPAAYLNWNTPIPTMAYSTYLLTMWFADAMMLWRLVIFYQGVHRITRISIISFASVIYIGIVGTGCVMLAMNGSDKPLFSKLTTKIAVSCFVLTVILNIFVSALISIRLLLFKRQMERLLGHKDFQTSPYTSIAAMLIESSALYAICSLVFIVVYVMGNPGQYVMQVLLCNVQVISPLLIVYRVSKGKGWEETTSSRLTLPQMTFSVPDDNGRSTITLEAHNLEHVSLDLSLKTVSTHSLRVESKESCRELHLHA